MPPKLRFGFGLCANMGALTVGAPFFIGEELLGIKEGTETLRLDPLDNVQRRHEFEPGNLGEGEFVSSVTGLSVVKVAGPASTFALTVTVVTPPGTDQEWQLRYNANGATSGTKWTVSATVLTTDGNTFAFEQVVLIC